MIIFLLLWSVFVSLVGPYFKTSILLMSDLTAQKTLLDVLLRALASLVANLVALEAELGIALKGVMGVTTA